MPTFSNRTLGSCSSVVRTVQQTETNNASIAFTIKYLLFFAGEMIASCLIAEMFVDIVKFHGDFSESKDCSDI